MRRYTFPVPAHCDAITLERFIRREIGLSAHVLKEQKYRENGITRNGQPCRTVDILQAGDVVALQVPEETRYYPPLGLPLSVLYEDADYLVIDKPAGMPVHPSPGHDCDSVLNAAAHHYGGAMPALRPLYRLDRDTSGALAFGKNRLTVSSAATAKRYVAVCTGVCTGCGTIDAPIGLPPDSKIRRVCCDGGQHAVTHWTALRSDGAHTLLQIELETGRTHQIRAHFSHIGHPLAGDDLYGGPQSVIRRQALHCATLQLKSPALGLDLSWAAPVPADMRAAFPALFRL